ADRHIPCNPLRAQPLSRKREHVRSLILPPESPVEIANRRIGRQQHRHLPLEPHGLLRSLQKPRQTPRRRQSKIRRFLPSATRSPPLRWSRLQRRVWFQILVEEDHRAQSRCIRSPDLSPILRESQFY